MSGQVITHVAVGLLWNSVRTIIGMCCLHHKLNMFWSWKVSEIHAAFGRTKWQNSVVGWIFYRFWCSLFGTQPDFKWVYIINTLHCIGEICCTRKILLFGMKSSHLKMTSNLAWYCLIDSSVSWSCPCLTRFRSVYLVEQTLKQKNNTNES